MQKLFGGIEIAERVERAERSLIEDGVLAAARHDPKRRALTLPVGSGLAAWAGEGSPLNKVVGVGFGGVDWDDRELERVEQALAERSAPVQFEVSTLADPMVVERLTRRGYVLRGFENVLGLPLAPGRPVQMAEGVEIREVADEDFDRWIDLVVSGFAAPDTEGLATHEEFTRDAVACAMRDLASAAGSARSIALVHGTPAGGAIVRLHARIAQLGGAATLPAFRRRGVQSSLLSARLGGAAAAGCDLAVVTTQPGSKSQRNVQAQGFELLYARAILVRPA